MEILLAAEYISRSCIRGTAWNTGGHETVINQHDKSDVMPEVKSHLGSWGTLPKRDRVSVDFGAWGAFLPTEKSWECYRQREETERRCENAEPIKGMKKKKFAVKRPEGVIKERGPKMLGEIRSQKPCLLEYGLFLTLG